MTTHDMPPEESRQWRLFVEALRERSLDELLHGIARAHATALLDVWQGNRTSSVTRARHEMWQALYSVHRMSLSEIGRLFGVHHTTVLSGIAVHGKRSATPIMSESRSAAIPRLNAEIAELRSRLEALEAQRCPACPGPGTKGHG